MPSINTRKIYISNGIYHIYNRGVEKRNIYFSNEDKTRFYKYLKHSARRYNIKIIKIVLTENHYHIIVQQKDNPRSIVKFMQSMGTKYVNYINYYYGRVGPLFQGRYKARLLVNEDEVYRAKKYLSHHFK